MAARKNKGTHERGWEQKTKDKIQTSMILNRLSDHVLGKLAKPMDSSQVTAALGLLKKVLPDLSSVDQKSEVVQHVVSDSPMQDEKWEDLYRLQ